MNGVPGAHLSTLEFTRFWISFSQLGAFAIGAGAPGAGACFSWTDPTPVTPIRHVGLSTWDKHTAYRDVQLHPRATLRPCPAPPACHEDRVPTLEALCEQAALAGVWPGDVCAALALAEALAPAAGRLRATGLRMLAEQLPAVLAADAVGFAALPAAVFEALLQGQSLVRPLRPHDMKCAWLGEHAGRVAAGCWWRTPWFFAVPATVREMLLWGQSVVCLLRTLKAKSVCGYWLRRGCMTDPGLPDGAARSCTDCLKKYFYALLLSAHS